MVSNNHDESITTTCMHIYYKNRRLVDITCITIANYWAVDNRWKWSPIHKIMGLAYLLIVTCRNESNTW